MGYSVMCPFKNEETKNRVLEFLSKNYKSFNQLCQTEGDCIDGPTTDLSYSPEEKIEVIGFNYSSGCDTNREYAFLMCYWMSIIAGNRKDIELDGTIYKDCPYIIYDGCEEWPLFVGNERPHNEFILVDEYGFKPLYKFKMNFILDLIFRKEIKKIEIMESSIKKELIRLTELYKKENL